jgi:hypothetical protein
MDFMLFPNGMVSYSYNEELREKHKGRTCLARHCVNFHRRTGKLVHMVDQPEWIFTRGNVRRLVSMKAITVLNLDPFYCRRMHKGRWKAVPFGDFWSSICVYDFENRVTQETMSSYKAVEKLVSSILCLDDGAKRNVSGTGALSMFMEAITKIICPNLVELGLLDGVDRGLRTWTMMNEDGGRVALARRPMGKKPTDDEFVPVVGEAAREKFERTQRLSLKEFEKVQERITLYRPIWSGNLKQGVKKMFGFSGKQAMFSLRDSHCVLVGIVLKGKLPWDIMYRCMINEHCQNVMRQSSMTMAKSFFRPLPLKMLRLLGGPTTIAWDSGGGEVDIRMWHHCQDAYSAYVQSQVRSTKSVKERVRREMLDHCESWSTLHRYLIREAAAQRNAISKKKRAARAKHRYEPKKAVKAWGIALEAKSIEHYTVRMPIGQQEVYDWGDKMQHCIGLYADQHLESCTLLGVFYDHGNGEGPVLKYNILLNKDRTEILQFYGKYNESPIGEIEDLVHGMLDIPPIGPYGQAIH